MARNVVSDLARLKYLSASLGRRGRRATGIPSTILGMIKNAEKEVNKRKFMEQIVQARFDAERARSDGGGSWKDRKNPGDGHPLLQLTGRLLTAAKRAVANTYNIVRVRWDIARVNCGYAIYHQRGTDRMPARPFLLDPSRGELGPADSYCVKVVKGLLRRALG